SAQPEDYRVTERAYVVLQKQNLVLAVLLLLMIIMAVCVYKPLSRR
uniref:Si:dkey-234h16.7 n=1 Tax=Amphilophus citrinellus TaxID=61819 RepID=A0A3Q0SFJ9_AMPCI